MTERMSWTAPADHPALPGHFPGNPLIPGVVLLDRAWRAARAQLPAGARLLGLSQAKFQRPVRPDERVEFEFSAGESTLGFRVLVAGELAAQGVFRFAMGKTL